MARTDIQVGKKRRFEAIFTDADGNEQAIDADPTVSVTDAAIGGIEDLVVRRDGQGRPTGVNGSLRLLTIGNVDVHVLGVEIGNPISLIGEANGIEGTVVGGRFNFGDTDEA